MTIRGQCRCGAVHYEIAAEDLPRSYACHCHQCQRWTGTALIARDYRGKPPAAARRWFVRRQRLR